MKTFYQFILEVTKVQKRKADAAYNDIATKAMKKMKAEALKKQNDPNYFNGRYKANPYGSIGHDQYRGDAITPDLLKHWGAGTGRPPNLWYSNGGDHLAIHPSIKREEDGSVSQLAHPDLSGFDSDKSQVHGRIDHIRKAISYHSSGLDNEWLQHRADKKTSLKRKIANSLATKYPGYTHHDADNRNEPI